MSLTDTQMLAVVNLTRQGCPAHRISKALGMNFDIYIAVVQSDPELRKKVFQAQKDYADDRRTRLQDHEIDHAAETAGRELTFTS